MGILFVILLIELTAIILWSRVGIIDHHKVVVLVGLSNAVLCRRRCTAGCAVVGTIGGELGIVLLCGRGCPDEVLRGTRIDEFLVLLKSNSYI